MSTYFRFSLCLSSFMKHLLSFLHPRRQPLLRASYAVSPSRSKPPAQLSERSQCLLFLFLSGIVDEQPFRFDWKCRGNYQDKWREWLLNKGSWGLLKLPWTGKTEKNEASIGDCRRGSKQTSTKNNAISRFLAPSHQLAECGRIQPPGNLLPPNRSSWFWWNWSRREQCLF